MSQDKLREALEKIAAGHCGGPGNRCEDVAKRALSSSPTELESAREAVIEAAKKSEKYISSLHMVGGEGDCTGGMNCGGCSVWFSLNAAIAQLAAAEKGE